jgi:hypothetical protein
MTSRSGLDPNMMSDPFFCRRAQVEIDARIRFKGHPSLPTAFPSIEEVCAWSVAEKARPPVKRRRAMRDRQMLP